jgi:outer membrane protein OmpA-like peptidoglycan-associated protein
VDDPSRDIGIVDHLVGFDVGFHVAPHDIVDIGVSLPMLQVQGSSDLSRQVAQGFGASGRTAGIGDLAVTVGIAPLRQRAGHALNLAVVPRFVLPTGTRNQFVGSGAVGLGADLAVGRRWKHFRFTADVGYLALTSSSQVSSVYADDELRYGLGLGVPVRDGTWEVAMQAYGGVVLAGGGRDALGDVWSQDVHAPAELLVGATYDPADKPVWLRFGAGPGLSRGWGTPDVRAFVQVGASKKAAPAPEPEPEPVDTDGDGVLDDADRCPETPEDVDGFEDTDGCLDDDNDADGVSDATDACPMQPEDADGFADDDGCPDDDNDGDGIADVDDACINAAEVLNGVDDTDGCPDEAAAVLDEDKGEIVIIDQVYFDLGKATIRAESHGILDAVAAVLAANPDVAGVEVQGHTDVRGSAASNLRLSQERVDAVRAYLIEAGIDADRLIAKGYGETQPIVEARTEAEHAQNRRVQFVVLD